MFIRFLKLPNMKLKYPPRQILAALSAAFSMLTLHSCGSSSSSEEEFSFKGFRWNVELVRRDSSDTWVESQGAQEWWFFKSGVFRQISSDYVEAEFYGQSQACNGTAVGSYTAEKIDGSDNEYKVDLTYEGLTQVRGLCRMTNRTIYLTEQPSEVVDLLDNKRVQRLTKLEPVE